MQIAPQRNKLILIIINMLIYILHNFPLRSIKSQTSFTLSGEIKCVGFHIKQKDGFIINGFTNTLAKPLLLLSLLNALFIFIIFIK